jgi:LemA protein
MSALSLAGVVVIAVLAALALSYNRLVRDRNAVAEAWGVIDSELARRHDLIPGLVASVQAAAAHERQLLDDLIRIERAAALTGDGPAERAGPERELAAAARAVVALRERYPALNTSQNFLSLQRELSLTEDRIGAARRFYNFKVADLNRRVEAFPSNLLASAARVARAAYFDPD